MRALAATAALALALTACAGTTDDATTTTADPGATTTVAPTTAPPTTVAPTTTTTTTTTTAPPTVGEPQTDAYTSDGYPGSGTPAFLTEVRTETYETFTRVVFEFNGEAAPEFTIEYVDRPVIASPSGNEVELAGDEALTIALAPASGVDLSGDEPVVTYTGADRLDIDSEFVSEMVKTEDFEAHLSWAIGTDDRYPFSFSTLPDPMRVIVDIHTADVTALGIEAFEIGGVS